jgi:hypothetical protein
MAALGALLQLADLELKNAGGPTTAEQFGAALTPLTRLTRLSVDFGSRRGGGCAALDCLPEAVFSLTALRALQFGGMSFVFRQGISPALAKLRRLEQLNLPAVGYQDVDGWYGAPRPTLADLPPSAPLWCGCQCKWGLCRCCRPRGRRLCPDFVQ